jgi:hypothetical protein
VRPEKACVVMEDQVGVGQEEQWELVAESGTDRALEGSHAQEDHSSQVVEGHTACCQSLVQVESSGVVVEVQNHGQSAEAGNSR